MLYAREAGADVKSACARRPPFAPPSHAVPAVNTIVLTPNARIPGARPVSSVWRLMPNWPEDSSLCRKSFPFTPECRKGFRNNMP